MSFLTFDKITIRGIAACVPKSEVNNVPEEITLFSPEELKKFRETAGVFKRRVTSSKICSSDLCYSAADNLLQELAIDRGTIDLLIFVSQTSDFLSPATSIILQDRLGLSKTTAAFDVNLGCTGYIYGMSIACSFLNQQSINRVLLLVGDTPSKVVSKNDKTNAILFGDAGSATLLEKSEHTQKAFFSLYSDGSGSEVIKIDAGAYRIPSTIETLKQREYSDGAIRSDEQVHMDGMEVFNFTMKEVPKSIKTLLTEINCSITDIDELFFHQANKFIIDYLAKRVKFPLEKLLYSITNFGNTSCASIPLTIVTEYSKDIVQKRIMLSAFGVGLSWANAVLDISNCKVLPIIEL